MMSEPEVADLPWMVAELRGAMSVLLRDAVPCAVHLMPSGKWGLEMTQQEWDKAMIACRQARAALARTAVAADPVEAFPHRSSPILRTAGSLLSGCQK